MTAAHNWAEVAVKKAGYELLEMHRPKQVVYILSKLFGYRCPPILITIKGPDSIRHETLPL